MMSFYTNGLRFECTRCSRCCRHDPGYVFLAQDDIDSMCEATGMVEERFLKRYCRAIDLNGFRRISLKEKKNYDCVFWVEDGCKIYNHRPLQCRSYPFWFINLYTQSDWEEVGASCPGVGRGPPVSRETIDGWLERQRRHRYLTPGERR